MDDFAVIYRILSALQKQMDYDEPNPDVVSADALNITQNRLDNIWAMLAQEKYVSGVMVNNFDNTRVVKPICPRITLLEHGKIINDLENIERSAEKELNDYFNQEV